MTEWNLKSERKRAIRDISKLLPERVTLLIFQIVELQDDEFIRRLKDKLVCEFCKEMPDYTGMCSACFNAGIKIDKLAGQSLISQQAEQNSIVKSCGTVAGRPADADSLCANCGHSFIDHDYSYFCYNNDCFIDKDKSKCEKFKPSSKEDCAHFCECSHKLTRHKWTGERRYTECNLCTCKKFKEDCTNK